MTNKWKAPISEQLKRLVGEMERGEFSESDMATLITRDKDTGILTLISMTRDGIDNDHRLFDEMARLLKYAKVQ